MIKYSLQLSVLLSNIELESTLNKKRVLFILILIISETENNREISYLVFILIIEFLSRSMLL